MSYCIRIISQLTEEEADEEYIEDDEERKRPYKKRKLN
jgi:hypothetical protein